MENSIKLGISACLLGEQVRYDGGHKLDRFLYNTLGKFVKFVPVCPEVECGLTVPRESMHLVGDPESPRLVTIKTRQDITPQMRKWAKKKLDELKQLDLCGYIFKSRSPSSGMERIKIHDDLGRVIRTDGTGIWARMFMERFPCLPVEDEGRLHDPVLRENFIERVFVFRRWRTLIASEKTINGLVDFHTRHKLLFMAHSPKIYREAGKLVANTMDYSIGELYERYFQLLTQAMSLKATISKHVNVLQHIIGYFKKQLTPDEKQEFLEILDDFRNGLVPLIVPVTLASHYVRRYDQPYLSRQLYLHPHPTELKLRTHV